MIDFYNVVFANEVQLKDTCFRACVTFQKTAFEDTIDIERCCFSLALALPGSRFKSATITRNQFRGVDARSTIYHEKANFSRNFFTDPNKDKKEGRGESSFEDSHFHCLADFSKNHFGNVDFSGATFEKGIRFGGTKFAGQLVLDRSTLVGDVELPPQYWKPAWWSRTCRYVRGTQTPSVSGMSVDGCSRMIFRRWVQDANYLAEWRSTHSRLRYWLWFLTSDFGNSTTFWVLSSSLLVLLFAAFYSASPELCFQQSLALSFKTFLVTLGFGGDASLSGWLGGLVVVEKTIGYGMLGLLIAILADKVVRRS